MANASRIFRQSALDRLSSPEQLDRLIGLTKPRDWLAALALAVVMGMGIAWSIVGTVPVRVTGEGILIATGGRVLDAATTGEGTLEAISAPIGSAVHKGDVVATVTNSELAQSLTDAEAVLAERLAQHEALSTSTQLGETARNASLSARRAALGARAADADERGHALEADVARQETLFNRGLVTWSILNNAKQALSAARQQGIEARSQLAATDDEAVAARNSSEVERRRSLDAIADARRQVVALEGRSRQRGVVVAPIDGRVTEWKAAPGSRIAPGQPVLSIEGGVTGTELLLYLPPDQGKQVRPGMKVWVAPSTVKREEFGTMIGTVTEVSDFPATTQAMMSILQNERLVQQFAPRGAPFAARVSLDADPSTPSGFRWSNGQGPATTLSSGTVASGDVTVDARAPVTYVIPWLRKATGIAG